MIDESPFNRQIGGKHYKDLAIQPAEYCHRNNIGKLEGDVIAYVTRWRKKGGITDLEKAHHTLELIIQMERAAEPTDISKRIGLQGTTESQAPRHFAECFVVREEGV